MTSFVHQSVLLQEAIEGLNIKKDGIYVDATFGRGGHSRAILERMGPQGRLIAIDLDLDAIHIANQAPFLSDPRFEIEHGSFSMLETFIQKRNLQGHVDGVLLDLGVSSPQLDDASRGFSFLRDGPLDMRMNTEQAIDAATWVSEASEKELADVIYQYGEERFSRRIARAIVAKRAQAPIQTTAQLADIVAQSVPKKEKHKHPATRTFQAIRIFVNKELEAIQQVLPQILNMMSVGGRLCVISFHSLEDRIVKRFIQRESAGDTLPPGLPIKDVALNKRLKKIGQLIVPGQSETENNPRARSSKLRIAEKIA